MPKTAGATSFLTLSLEQLQAEAAAGHIDPAAIVIGKTWWERNQLNKIRKGYQPAIVGAVGAANVPVVAAPPVNGAPTDELQKDDTPLEEMAGINVD